MCVLDVQSMTIIRYYHSLQLDRMEIVIEIKTYRTYQDVKNKKGEFLKRGS